jgi:hypothetical protein
MATSGSGDFSSEDAREYGASSCFAGVPLKTLQANLRSIYHTRLGAIRQTFAIRRSTLRGAQVNADLRLTHLRQTHTANETSRARIVSLRKGLADFEAHKARLDQAIRAKRQAAERQRIEAAIGDLSSQEKRSVDRLATARLEQHQRDLALWHESEVWRAKQIEEIISERDKAKKESDDLEARIAKAVDPLITRTVAGFLIWVGYSSVAAIGAAVALILGAKPDLGTAVLGQLLASMTLLLRDAPAWTLLLLPIFVLIVVALIGAVFYFADWAIDRFDPRGWKRDRKHAALEGGLPTIDLSRRSYVRVLAALPFIYVAGLITALLCVAGRLAPKGSDPDKLLAALNGFSDSMANTLIGSVMALLITSVFILYLVKIIERRLHSGQPLWKHSWEIAALPVMLLTALGVALLDDKPTRQMWAVLSAFMLMSSLALAYGVVYRGLFRDVDRARWHVRSIDELLASYREPPAIAEPGGEERDELRHVRRTYRMEREWLEELEREREIGRTFGLDDAADAQLVQRWLDRRRSKLERMRSATITPTVLQFRVLDLDAAPEEVKERDRVKISAQIVSVDLTTLEQAVSDTSAQRETDAILAAERDLSERMTEVARLPFEEKEEIARLAEAYQRYASDTELGYQTAKAPSEAIEQVKPELRPPTGPRRIHATV